MRCTVMVLVFLLGLALFPAQLLAAPDSGTTPVISVQETLEKLDFTNMEEFKNQIDKELNPVGSTKSIKQWLIDFASGNWKFDYHQIFKNLGRLLFKEMTSNSSLLAKLIILSVIAALLINLQTSFSSGIGKMSYMACFLALAALALGSFRIALGIGHQTIDNMVNFMMGMLPPMMMLVAGLGNINTTAMLFPLLMTTATAFADGIKLVVFPLIIMSALLSLANNISETVKVERMAKFCSQMAQLALGFLLTIFVGIVTLKAVYASVLDKVVLRSTRFVTDNAIPIVGKMVGDTIEVAAGYVAVIKDALGILGVLIILGIIVAPLLKIAILAFIYKLAGAAVEPMGDNKTAAVLEIMSVHLMMLLAATAAVGLMFFIMIAIIAGLSNSFAVR